MAWKLSSLGFILSLPLFVYSTSNSDDSSENSGTLKSIAIDNSTLLWGTYRPNLFFGTRTRLPDSVMTGLVWHSFNDLNKWDDFRHSCEQSEDFTKYGYIQHDGRYFGIQEVEDAKSNLLLRTEFVKVPSSNHGGDWAVRISGKALVPGLATKGLKTGLVFYISTENEGTLKKVQPEQDQVDCELQGESPSLGNFTLRLYQGSKNVRVNSGSSPDSPEEIDTSIPSLVGHKTDTYNVWMIQDYLKTRMNEVASRRLNPILKDLQNDPEKFPEPGYLFGLESKEDEDSNLYIFQNIFEGDFELDIVYSSSGSSHIPDRDEITKLLKKRSQNFQTKFQRTFGFDDKGFSFNKNKFAEAAMSNMLGGIGYFHGDSIVKKLPKPLVTPDDSSDGEDLSVGDFDDDDEEEHESVNTVPDNSPEFEDETKSDTVERTSPMSLFTSVPSRPFFPRGFLWDEGFHLILISEWDSDLSLEIIKSWYELIDDNGWIAREQILGPEARSKVPPKFQTQYQDYANPPTLFIAIEKFLRDMKDPEKKSFISNNLKHDPFLNRFEDDIVHDGSAAEDILMTMKHLGDAKLGKSWLKSIYPLIKRNYLWYRRTQFGQLAEWGRDASSPEAYRWRGRTQYHCLTSGLDDYPRGLMSDGELHVDLLSWMGLMSRILSEIAHTIGEVDDEQQYQKHYADIQKNLLELHWIEEEQTFCDLSVDSDGNSVPACHKGYISILPMALGLLSPDSPQLAATLDLIQDPKHLWTPYGLRSLSQSHPLYYKEESYWRGPIWLNINYMVLSSLYRNYMDPSHPHHAQATKIYTELRQNLIDNLFKEYQRTGYLWEQYSAVDGVGQGSRPFTGWTSLVVMIMAEKY